MRSKSLAVAVLAGWWFCSCAPKPPAPPPTTQPLAWPRDLPGLPNFAQVSEVLYRGAQPIDNGPKLLYDMHIKTVVDLRGKIHRDDLEGKNFKYFHIPSDAARPSEQQIVQFLRIVRDPANQPVFVHCQRGADRTGCYVAAYRMVEQGWSARDAEAELPRFHFDPFWQAIPDFLNKLDPEKVRQEIKVETMPTTEAADQND